MVDSADTRTEKGISLARGPALIVGTILLAAGLYFLYREHTFLKFSNFPSGDAPVTGKVFGIFGANGWTGMLTAVGGGLLLFGAAQHLLAKTMSLIVGIALGAAAIIALISGNVLGMAAANGWTELAWGIAAAFLLFNTAIPRRRTEVATGYEDGAGRRRGRAAVPAAGAAGAGTAAAADTRIRREDAPTRVESGDAATRVEPGDAPTRVGPGDAATREPAAADSEGTAAPDGVNPRSGG
ncbi:MAG: hypothetical protein ACR2MK_06700 [Solirubrobacteraceae bacterium]